VRNPWLDDDILDFMRRVPVNRRRGKVLFRNVIKTMFPDIFDIPVSVSSGKVTLAAKHDNRQKYFHEVQAAFFDGEYPIDCIFDSQALRNYMLTKESIKTQMKALAVSSLSPFFLKSVQKAHSWVSKFSRYPTKFEFAVSTQQVLERIIILRYIVGEQMKLSF
jgi:hypothetical protein